MLSIACSTEEKDQMMSSALFSQYLQWTQGKVGGEKERKKETLLVKSSSSPGTNSVLCTQSNRREMLLQKSWDIFAFFEEKENKEQKWQVLNITKALQGIKMCVQPTCGKIPRNVLPPILCLLLKLSPVPNAFPHLLSDGPSGSCSHQLCFPPSRSFKLRDPAMLEAYTSLQYLILITGWTYQTLARLLRNRK